MSSSYACVVMLVSCLMRGVCVCIRFYYQGMWREKITADVDFPMDNLDMNPHVSGPKNVSEYSLYGVSVSPCC